VSTHKWLFCPISASPKIGICQQAQILIMVVGIGKIIFRLHDCRSLKEKRKIVKAITNRLRNSFNASVAEVGANDIHQRAEIGFALAGNDRMVINSKIDKMFNMADNLGLAEIIDTDMEIMSL